MAKLFSPEKKTIQEPENSNKEPNRKNKKKLVTKKAKKKFYSAQKTIPIHQIETDGIFEVSKGRFSKTIFFTDINYQTARPEDQIMIFEKYCNLINFFDPTIDVQITINNKGKNKVEFENSTLIEPKNDGLNNLREEYNNMLLNAVTEGNNDIDREKYITFTIPAKNIDDAKVKLFRLESEVSTSLKRLGSKVITLDTKERLEILHDFYRPGNEGLFMWEKENKPKQISYKDLIAPDSFEFKKDHFMIGDKFARVLFIRDYPTFMNDKLITEITDLPFNMMLSISIKPIEQSAALKIINKQIVGMETDKIKYQKRSTKSGYFDAFIPNDLKFSLEEAQELLDNMMNKNQKMFYLNTTIIHTADTLETLNEDSKEIISMGQKYLVQIGKLDYQQELAMGDVLPIGNKRLPIDRTLTTESAAVLIPFTSQELMQPGGVYYGINQSSRNLILFDRKTLDNASGFYVGTPGSGKSFSAKRELVDILLRTNDDVIYIDPERECTTLARGLGGEIIHISAASKHHINPMDINLNYADDDDPISLKSEFIMSICDIAIGGKDGLNPNQKAIIDKCLRKVYSEFLTNPNEANMPTLMDFWKVLDEEKSETAKDIAEALTLYVTGSLSSFSHKTNIDVNNRFIVFDTKDLGKQLKTLGLLIVLDQVWNRITQNRALGKRTWIYIDEIYLLFNNDYSANFLYELYKRARKWGGIPTGITQNVEDLLRSDQARTMLSNSKFIMMLNQAHSDRKELSKLLGISENQLGYVTNTPAGQGLMFADGAIIPFVDKFPSDTKLYQMMTTKVDEIDRSIA